MAHTTPLPNVHQSRIGRRYMTSPTSTRGHLPGSREGPSRPVHLNPPIKNVKKKTLIKRDRRYQELCTSLNKTQESIRSISFPAFPPAIHAAKKQRGTPRSCESVPKQVLAALARQVHLTCSRRCTHGATAKRQAATGGDEVCTYLNPRVQVRLHGLLADDAARQVNPAYTYHTTQTPRKEKSAPTPSMFQTPRLPHA